MVDRLGFKVSYLLLLDVQSPKWTEVGFGERFASSKGAKGRAETIPGRPTEHHEPHFGADDLRD